MQPGTSRAVRNPSPSSDIGTPSSHRLSQQSFKGTSSIRPSPPSRLDGLCGDLSGKCSRRAMAELNGSIALLDLLVVIQSLGDERRTGRLCLSRSPRSAELDFADGRLVAASFGDAGGLAAIPALLLA